MPYKIILRGRERWQGAVMVGGVRRQRLFDSRHEALAWEASERAKLRTAKTPTGYLTIREWLNRYLEYCELEFRPRTFKQKRTAIKRFLKSARVRPESAPDAITQPVVMAYLTKQRKARGPVPANYDRKNLGAAWTWGSYNLAGWPQAPDPFRAVRKFKADKAVRYVPPEADFWRVYDTASEQMRVLLLTFLHTAGRKMEILQLQWRDIDWAANRIRLYTRKRETGMESDLLPMTSDLRAALRGWWENRPIKDSPYVFVIIPNRCNAIERYFGRPYSDGGQIMPRLCDAAKVRRFGFHAIRHLTASILYHRGVDRAVIQAILRHRRASTTDIYLRSLGVEVEGVGDALRRPGVVIEIKEVERGA